MSSREFILVVLFTLMLAYTVTLQFFQMKFLLHTIATGEIAIGQALELVLSSDGKK